MKLKHLMTGTALAVVSAGGAFGGDYGGDHANQWYMSFGVGGNWIGSNTGLGQGANVFGTITNTNWTTTGTFNHTSAGPATSITTSTVSSPLRMADDPGFAIMGTVGYRFDSPWRVEFEASVHFNDIAADGPEVTGTGHEKAIGLLANVVYDVSLGERFTLNLGAGIGFGIVNMKASGQYAIPGIAHGIGTGTFCTGACSFSNTFTSYFSTTHSVTATGSWRFDARDEGFAYQGIVGFSYDIGNESELFLDYRYFVVSDLSLNPTGPHINGLAGSDDYASQSATIGIRYFFNSGN